MRVISTRVHGVLDYMTAAALFAIPRMFNWNEGLTMAMTMAAIGTVVYSLLTRYEMGLARAIPMRAHLAIDLMMGVLFLGAALFLNDHPDTVRMTLGAIGLFEIGASLMTDPTPAHVADGGHVGTRQRGF